MKERSRETQEPRPTTPASDHTKMPKSQIAHLPPPPAGKPIRVVVVEDDEWLRENMAAEINQAGDLQCVNGYSSGEAALKGIPGDSAQVVLMDIGLPGMDGVECVRKLKTVLPSAQVLMLTVYAESERVFAALLAGADGYLLKRSTTEELTEAIRKVHQGESPMDWRIARQMAQYFGRMGKARPGLQVLTGREREVLELLARGAGRKEIADRLGIAAETLTSHIKSIYQKLHAHSRGEAAAAKHRK